MISNESDYRELFLLFHHFSSFIMALAGVRVIELAGLAPAPFCGMILADFGAKVIRVDRTKVAMSLDTQARGKKSVAINLKTSEGVALLRKLCVQSDVVLEPYRKGQTTRYRTAKNKWWKKCSDPLLKIFKSMSPLRYKQPKTIR